MIELRGIQKILRRPPRAGRSGAGFPAGRAVCADRPERKRQDDASAHPRRDAQTGCGRADDRRRGKGGGRLPPAEAVCVRSERAQKRDAPARRHAGRQTAGPARDRARRLTHLAKARGSRLSGGEAQRMAVARCIARPRKVLPARRADVVYGHPGQRPGGTGASGLRAGNGLHAGVFLARAVPGAAARHARRRAGRRDGRGNRRGGGRSAVPANGEHAGVFAPLADLETHPSEKRFENRRRSGSFHPPDRIFRWPDAPVNTGRFFVRAGSSPSGEARF